MAFFPAYPLLMRAGRAVVGNSLLAGVMLTVAAGATAAGLFFTWLRERVSPEAAWTVSASGQIVRRLRDAQLTPMQRYSAAGTTSLAYDGSNKLKRIQDVGGRITSYSVNGSGDLVQTTSPELCVTNWTYNGSHQVTSWTDPGGGYFCGPVIHVFTLPKLGGR